MTTSTTTAGTTGAVVPHRVTEMSGLPEDLLVNTTAGSGSSVPVLHGGAGDPVLPVTTDRQLAAALLHSTSTAVPSAGHLPFRDQPLTTFAAVDTFLSRRGPDAPAGTTGQER